MSLRPFLLAGTIAACFQLAPVALRETAATANDQAQQQFLMPIVRPVPRVAVVAANDAPPAPPPAPPAEGAVDAGPPAAAGPAAPVHADYAVAGDGCQTGAAYPYAADCQYSNGYVSGDGGWCNACGACNDRTCREELHYYFSKGCRCRSTCDMPPHFPYFPEYHGYYYFRPYNWQHVWMHQALAPMLGEAPHTPYATTAFDAIYEQVLPAGHEEEDTARQTLPFSPGLERGLPDLEELLKERDQPEPESP
ncbi:MAG: hypothetical protein WD069_18705 [Planctomycetales bacterium]